MRAAWWPAGGETVQVIATERLWGRETATILVPSSHRVEQIAADDLEPLSTRRWSSDEVVWLAARGLVERARAGGEPFVVASGLVEPLPHQIDALGRAMSADPLRLLLADEVGLGKTIEAGLIISELKARGAIRRILVVAPKGVQLQWIAEMADRFGEELVLVGPGGLPLDAGVDLWRRFDQVICSLDAVKPMRSRAGWTAEQILAHNDARIGAVVDATWDLVIIDEAHHVAGSSEDVARHQLARRLSETTPRLLLLSATPHSGKSDAFARLLGLLDDRFLHGRPVERSTISPLVVRAEKRKATRADGRPLFQPRTTRLDVVPYGARDVERSLYEAVTDYVRNGYRRSQLERRPAVGFLVLLMQRLVSSSTSAILAALERRLASLTTEADQPYLLGDRLDGWDSMTGEEQLEAVRGSVGAAWAGERTEVQSLVDLARKTRSSGIDAKARHLLHLLGDLARSEGDPDVKAVVFTEFLTTQEMLLDLLSGSGISAVGINGSMSIGERRDAQEAFRADRRVLVSTDAGGEGVNLQVAHCVVNYDLPWSPTRIEQRLGRVDRIGQRKPVVAYNLVLESSIDARVLEVLADKLATILAEVGIDKAGEILASSDLRVEDIYTTALLDGDVDQAIADVAKRAAHEQAEAAPLREVAAQAPASLGRPVTAGPWVAAATEAARRLGRGLWSPLPEVLPGEPVPCVAGPAPGWWTLWHVDAGGGPDCFALFVADTGAVRPDRAERLWVALASGPDLDGVEMLHEETHARLVSLAADHGYRPPSDGAVPRLNLRLAVRTR